MTFYSQPAALDHLYGDNSILDNFFVRSVRPAA